MLDGGPNANPKPSLSNGVPTIYTSQVPTERHRLHGPARTSSPINGTQLLQATNTHADVFVDTTNEHLTTCCCPAAGSAPVSMNGPWSFVASNALPADFARISAGMPAAVVLRVGGRHAAGTRSRDRQLGARPATLPRVNGPKFVPVVRRRAAVSARSPIRRCRTR